GFSRDWSSDVCSSDLVVVGDEVEALERGPVSQCEEHGEQRRDQPACARAECREQAGWLHSASSSGSRTSSARQCDCGTSICWGLLHGPGGLPATWLRMRTCQVPPSGLGMASSGAVVSRTCSGAAKSALRANWTS